MPRRWKQMLHRGIRQTVFSNPSTIIQRKKKTFNNIHTRTKRLINQECLEYRMNKLCFTTKQNKIKLYSKNCKYDQIWRDAYVCILLRAVGRFSLSYQSNVWTIPRVRPWLETLAKSSAGQVLTESLVILHRCDRIRQ